MLSGCTQLKWKHEPPIKYEWKSIPQDNGSQVNSYNYYVIDSNSDIPDAFFDTLDEAKTYKKYYAANHDYVIVKTNEKYSVYHMTEDILKVQK